MGGIWKTQIPWAKKFDGDFQELVIGEKKKKKKLVQSGYKVLGNQYTHIVEIFCTVESVVNNKAL